MSGGTGAETCPGTDGSGIAKALECLGKNRARSQYAQALVGEKQGEVFDRRRKDWLENLHGGTCVEDQYL